MRPIRSFLLLLIFLACFTGLHYIVPADWLFPPLTEIIPSHLLKKHKIFNLPEGTDTIGIKATIHGLATKESVELDSVKALQHSFDPLDPLRDSLERSTGQVRILYYGDSQIEGDRMTSYLRKTLREMTGGTGPGMFLPVMPVMYTKTTWLRSSSNWKRYNYLSYRQGDISHRQLGPFMVICRYLPEGKKSDVTVNASVRIRPSNMADSSSSVYDQLRIFYRSNEGRVDLTVFADEKIIASDTLRSGNFNEFTCSLNKASEIRIEFSGKVSPDIYGISIESITGLIIDNIPQRGSAGLEFTMVDSLNLAESYKSLQPDLFILQYGLNIVRNVRVDYSYYSQGLSRQLALLKKISPGIPILVVGLTEMAQKEGDSIRPYKNIPLIIDAQKKAALGQDVSFWNAYEAMGGKGSIMRWRDKKPPLVQKDLVHLTYAGSDTLSMRLVDSLFSLADETHKTDAISGSGTLPVDEGSEPDQYVTATGDAEQSGDLAGLLLSYDAGKPLIFTSSVFWLFLLFVLAGYSIVYKKLFLRNFYLMLVSLFFYYKSGGLFLLLLLLVILIDFLCGLAIYKSRTRLMRRFFILASIISNLGILAYFKYTGFIVNTINDIFGTDFKIYDFLAGLSNVHLGTSFSISNIILPVGISFFTFQSLSYTLDVYREKLKPVRNIIDFGFYVSFFPQLVAGPIVRASEFIPQLYARYHLEKREFSHALFLISKGLIKKIIISDFIAVNFIDRVFDAPAIYSGFENLMAVYGYGLQIYCDFSGYTDIAIGIALIFGFRLPVNFNSPYKAEGISDFWKRWHISLSRWLKDYLYIPLGGNRKGKIRTNINLLITMLLGGLWHGADMRFIIWGFLHGIGLIIERIWRSLSGKRKRESRIMRALAVFITFHFVSFSWIFFRAPDMQGVRLILNQIFENFSPGSYLTLLGAYSNVFLLITIGYIIHLLPENFKESYRGFFIRIPLAAQLVIIMVIAVILFQMRSTETLPFIYFRF